MSKFRLMKWILFLLPFFIYAGECKYACRTGITPDPPATPQYWAKIEVTYDRDPTKIINPEGNDKGTGIYYALFDPDRKIKSQYDSEIDGYYRMGYVPMEKIAENKFRGYIEQVFVQTESWHAKHSVYARDLKLYDGISSGSTYTPHNVIVQYAYDTEIYSYQLKFKTAKSTG